jgi:hypothetical protein
MLALTPQVELLTVPAPMVEPMAIAVLMDKVEMQLGSGLPGVVLVTNCRAMGLGHSLAMALQHPLLPKVRQ